jgi:hypothetical protein
VNIHRGIDDDNVGKEGNRKTIFKDMTSRWSHLNPIHCFFLLMLVRSGDIHGIPEVQSPHWHTRIQHFAHAFLNQFVRRFPGKSTSFPSNFLLLRGPFTLSLLTFASSEPYQNVEGQLDNDRDRRQQEALGNSKTAEESLIKRCSHFDLDNAEHEEEDLKGTGKAAKEKAAEGKSAEKVVQENAVQACDFIIAAGKKQLASCCEDVYRPCRAIRRTLRDTLTQHEEIPQNEPQENSGTRIIDNNSCYVKVSR